MTLRRGEVVENAMWLDGNDDEAQSRWFAGATTEYLAGMAEHHGAIFGPTNSYMLKPGDERLPPVPDHIHGPNVRMLITEAEVVGQSLVSESLFVADVDPKDLERLRGILRRVHQSWNPGKKALTNEQCDDFINQNGPDAALAALREQVGSQVH